MKQMVFLALALSSCVAFSATPTKPDLLIADFEGSDYGAWKVTGNAFGSGPARGTLPNQMPVDGYEGKGLANSYHGGDDSVGTLTSPPFKLERSYLQFLIGGGKNPGKTCLNLLVDGKVVRSASGPNDKPGGSERLDLQWWDVTEFAGKQAVLEIVDQAKGGWGHINVDHIQQTDRKPLNVASDQRRTYYLQNRFLNFPIKNGAPKRLMSVLIDGRLARQFEIELAEKQADWWAFLDVAEFRGETAVLAVDRLRENSNVWELIHQADEVKGAQDLYQESLRPQFHFSSRRGWLNDPNGLVFYNGEYHLFYQHNPFGWNWGNMHWGHAVSRDLVHWAELGDALYPDEYGTMFSGSAVVDWLNTTGFGREEHPALVAMYTAAGNTSPWSKNRRFTQALAYSTDRGRTWIKYEKNPVLDHVAAENRDPKVIWHAPTHQWVMALYLDRSDFALFGSPDLKQWRRLCDIKIEGTSECPEFFEIPVEGNTNNTRWVFYGANGGYLVGRFDGTNYTADSGPHMLHFGNCFYASQTYSDIPAADGRRILVGWGQINFPGMPFNQMMDFPVELTLRNTDEGLRLFVNPVREIATLRTNTFRVAAKSLKPGENPLAELAGELFEIETALALGQASEVGLNVRGVPVVYDPAKQELSCLGKKAKLKATDGQIRLRLLVDRGSIEIYANDGRIYMPMGTSLKADQRRLELYAKGGEARIESAVVHALKSAWRR